MRFFPPKFAAARSRWSRILVFSPVALAIVACVLGTRPKTARSQQPGVSYAAPANASVQQSAAGAPAVVRVSSPNGQIVLGTTPSRVAGAIDYLMWNGKQFVNSYDHGREMQYAWQINPVVNTPLWNPTEAGSAADGTGPTTTSQNVLYSVSNNILATSCNPANFMTSFQGSNVTFPAVSPETFQKTVTVGLPGLGMPNVIQFVASITIPQSEAGVINSMRVEAPTPYLNGEFNTFYLYDPPTTTTQPITAASLATRSEFGAPTIIATANGAYAVGVYSPNLPQPEQPYNAYGMASYITPGNPTAANSCSKSVVLFHLGPMPPGTYNFYSYVIVGSLNTVKSQMTTLYNYFHQ